MIWFGRHSDVERHFAGVGSPARDQRMFQHLRQCPRCRDRYRTYSSLEELAPGGGEQARERLGRGIFRPARRRAAWGVGLGLGLATVCAALVLVVVHPSDGFRARGGSGASAGDHPSLSIFRVAADGVTRVQRAGSSMRASEPLAFSFTNPGAAGYDHLMVFAVDSHGRVFWFWPAWENPDDDPNAIVVSPGAQPMELGESIRHQLSPGRITIYGFFSSQPHHVRQVEAALGGGPAGLAALGGYLWSESLDVTP